MDQIEQVIEAILEGRKLEAKLLFKDLLSKEADKLMEMASDMEDEDDDSEEDETEDTEEKGDDEVEEDK